MARLAAIVEFHGFKDNDNRFVVKELAIVSEHFQAHLVFSAPYSESCLSEKMRKTADWLTNHFHFIRWDETGVPFDEELIRVLCSQFSILYTKGEEKLRFLRQFHNNVQGIKASFTHPCVSKDNCILPQHNSYKGRCAMRSAKAFYKLLFGKKI